MRRFTILLAAHNRLELLKQAVASAVAEASDQDEVLVIDDGSDEETQAWLDQAAADEAKLRVIHQENQGVAAARANGVEAAEGEFVDGRKHGLWRRWTELGEPLPDETYDNGFLVTDEDEAFVVVVDPA